MSKVLEDLRKGREQFYHLQATVVLVFREAYEFQKTDKNKEWKPPLVPEDFTDVMSSEPKE